MSSSTIAEDLASNDIGRRRSAAEYLSRHPVEPAMLVPLVRAAGDEDEQVREWAVAALEEMGSPDASVMEGLLDLLDESHQDIAYWSATLIGRLGDAAAPAADRLGSIVGNEGPIAVRQRAAWALGEIGPAAIPALPALEKAAEHADPRLARQARRALDAIGSA